jgi:hypothetical protein
MNAPGRKSGSLVWNGIQLVEASCGGGVQSKTHFHYLQKGLAGLGWAIPK